MPTEKKKILEFNQHMKSDKMTYIIYANIEWLIRKINGCANNPEKLSTMKIDEHIPCVYSMSTIWVFDHIENKHALYRRRDCMKNFCNSLKEHTKNTIFFENKKMLPLTKKELKPYQEAKICYICGNAILEKFTKDKNYRKVRDHCHYTGKYRGAADSICNLKFNVSNEIPVVFHRVSNYDYYFINKE